MLTDQRLSCFAKSAAAALLAFGVLAGSAAPSAAGMWAPHDRAMHRSTFHHHFYRGVSRAHDRLLPANARASDDAMLAMSDEATQNMDEATSYCMSRFKSYEPATGTYLGYDGNEHPCP